MPFAPDLDEHTKRRLVREGYDAIAEHYQELVGAEDAPDAPRREWTAKVLARLNGPGDVLELGCGGGMPVGQLLVDAGHSYVGVDVSPRQLDLAHGHLPDANLICGDAVDQFAAASFDAVFMLYAITHIPREHWRSVVDSIAGWLRPGGVFLVNVPLKGVPSWLEEDFLGSGCTNWTNSLDPETTRRLMGRAGLVILETAVVPEGQGPGQDWLWLLATRAG